MPSLFSRIAHPVIRTERDLARFVVTTCIVCAVAAVAVDVVNQLVFFTSWADSFRSWIITAGLATAIAFPVSRAIGKAHLQLFRSKTEVEILSRTDELTGLLNRRALMQVADTVHPETMVLVIADIDRFKLVNDNHGHLAGDAVIRMVSDLARQELGDLGHLGRIGGEEFALLCADVPPALLMLRLENLRTRISLTPTFARGSVPIHVTISAGVAVRGAGRSFDDLYAEADQALYEAKAAGRNRISCSIRFAEARDKTADGGTHGGRTTRRFPAAAGRGG